MYLEKTIWERYNLITDIIRATSWENLFKAYANNKGADQPAHPRSLISTFVIRFLDSTSTCYIRNSKTLARLWSWVGRFESYLVENPEVRFSHDEAHNYQCFCFFCCCFFAFISTEWEGLAPLVVALRLRNPIVFDYDVIKLESSFYLNTVTHWLTLKLAGGLKTL